MLCVEWCMARCFALYLVVRITLKSEIISTIFYCQFTNLVRKITPYRSELTRNQRHLYRKKISFKIAKFEWFFQISLSIFLCHRIPFKFLLQTPTKGLSQIFCRHRRPIQIDFLSHPLFNRHGRLLSVFEKQIKLNPEFD